MTRGVETGEALPTQVLHPVLDTYLNSAVGITGCHSYGIARGCCEFDVVVVSNETAPSSSMRNGDAFIDLYFMSEKEVLGPSDPEVAVSLASIKPVRDNSLIFSTSSAAAKAVIHENLKKSAEGRLAKSLKSLGRADAALTRGSAVDADYWLMSSAYEYAFAWLYSAEATPAPSHLLEQLKAHSRESPGSYEAVSRAVGLEKASRASCAERLEALSVVADAIGTSKAGENEDLGSTSARTAFEVVKAKSAYLSNSIMHVDCYSFLGLEVCGYLPLVSLVRSGPPSAEEDLSQIVSSVSEGDKRVIGERLVRGLGLTRDREAIVGGIEGLRTEISGLAKNI